MDRPTFPQSLRNITHKANLNFSKINTTKSTLPRSDAPHQHNKTTTSFAEATSAVYVWNISNGLCFPTRRQEERTSRPHTHRMQIAVADVRSIRETHKKTRRRAKHRKKGIEILPCYLNRSMHTKNSIHRGHSTSLTYRRGRGEEAKVQRTSTSNHLSQRI
jgi:hypothetical protein